MTVLSRDDLRPLLQTSGGPCVSIYLPTFRSGSETQQNPIRYKNLLRAAQERLEGWGLRPPEAEELLEPARRLVDDYPFWQHQSEGLAVYRSPDLFEAFRLPVSFHELAVVENRFHLKPLFPLLSGNGRFYVLALSQNRIRLISASRYEAEELELPGVPTSFREAMGELVRRYTQFQPATSSNTIMLGRGARVATQSPVFHGHGSSEEDLKAEFRTYFQRVDDALSDLPVDRDLPVVLAGVEYLLPMYREASDFRNILDEGLAGNADAARPDELKEQAWEIVEPVFLEERRRAAERYGDFLGTGRASHHYEEVLPAAHDGRVETLFVARGVRLWGQYDPEARTVKLQDDQAAQRNGAEDLIDLAAVQTILNSGTVFAVDRPEVPDGQAMAAIFRY
jgi:hypothetical protein